VCGVNDIIHIFVNCVIWWSCQLLRSYSIIHGWINMGHWWNDTDRGQTVPVPLCSSLVTHRLAWDRTQASTLRCWWLNSVSHGKATQFILDCHVTCTLAELSEQHLAQTYYHSHVEKPSSQFEQQFWFYRSHLTSSYVSQHCSTIFHFSLLQKNISCYRSLHKQHCSVCNELTSLICIGIKEPAFN
jgi:hypothetical protein